MTAIIKVILLGKDICRRHTTLILLLLAQAVPASAHNGPPFPLFENVKLGPCMVALWTHPDVGTGTFFVLVDPLPNGSVPDDLAIKIGVQPISGRIPEVVYAAQRVKLRGQVQYNVQTDFDRQELWRIRLILQSAQGVSEASAQVEVTPTGFGRWDLLFYALPFLAVGFLWSRAIMRSNARKNKHQTGRIAEHPIKG